MEESKMLTNIRLAEIAVEYRASANRLILLDYDGTLVNIQNDPYTVVPDKEVLKIIRQLASNDKNTVAIITGRDKEYISKWFGDMNLYIFAEHGSFIKEPDLNNWTSLFNGDQNWKQNILPVLEAYTEKTQGSMIEQKISAVAWHYRNVDPKHALIMVEKLYNSLKKYVTPTMNVNILEGKKVIEIKQKGYDKGSASKKMIQLKNFGFILSIGDDTTDEDMFKALPSYGYSFKVGYGITNAKMNIENPTEVINLLKKLLQW